MDAFTDNAEPVSLGRYLALERERQGLSRADVAQRLHLSPSQVEAMEEGDYERLPRGTFLRGFVRNYARLLGLDADAALDRLAQDAPRDPAPGIVVPSQNIRFDPLAGQAVNPYVRAGGLAVVAVALAFAAMYWWLFIRPAPPAAPANGTAATQPTPDPVAPAPLPPPEAGLPTNAPSEPAATPPGLSPEGAESPPATGAQAPSAVAALPSIASAPAPTGAPDAPAAAPGARMLQFRFRGDSWVEVKDRSGAVLLSRLNSAGSEARVTGQPPFTVVIGNAPEVSLTYDGREFPLEPHTKVAVARFTLE